MRGQAQGQQADRPAGLPAHEAPHLRARRAPPRIRPVGPQLAGPPPAPRAARRSCQIPGPPGNIFLVGEIGLEQDLHAYTGHGPASCFRAGHPKQGREGPLPFAAPARGPLLPYRRIPGI